MNKDDDRTLKKVLVGTVIAATAGYIAGLLTAPKSGKETRDNIKVAARKRRDDAEHELKHLYSELGEVIDDAKSRSSELSAKAQDELKDLVAKARTTKDKTREVIGAIHSGDPEDDDLRRAINNAKNSLDNLKDYIKK